MSKNAYSFWPQFWIAVDQLLNVFPCFGYADETLSARAFRAWRKNRIMGRLLMPVIDALFFWQEQDDEVNATAGRAIAGHCERAFWKEKLRRSLPPEYRELEKE